jgi:hypothetical protein
VVLDYVSKITIGDPNALNFLKLKNISTSSVTWEDFNPDVIYGVETEIKQDIATIWPTLIRERRDTTIPPYTNPVPRFPTIEDTRYSHPNKREELPGKFFQIT